MKPPKYTAKQIDEIINRITALRVRWLQSVEAQLASSSTATSLTAGAHLNWIQPRPGRTARAVMLDVKSAMTTYF
jgi:hypothetical protein